MEYFQDRKLIMVNLYSYIEVIPLALIKHNWVERYIKNLENKFVLVLSTISVVVFMGKCHAAA